MSIQEDLLLLPCGVLFPGMLGAFQRAMQVLIQIPRAVGVTGQISAQIPFRHVLHVGLCLAWITPCAWREKR